MSAVISGAVLLVDDEERRVALWSEQLALDGFIVRAAARERAARALFDGAQLIVLGALDGSAAPTLALLREIRAGTLPTAPRTLRAIALANTEPQMLSAFAAGADLTLPRGASGSVLSAGVLALIRRGWQAPERIRIGRLEVDRAGRTATIDTEPVALTRREFALLDAMAQAPGRVFTRDELSREVWGTPDLQGSRALDTHISRIGSKLRSAGAGALVQNVWGQGYKIIEGAER